MTFAPISVFFHTAIVFSSLSSVIFSIAFINYKRKIKNILK
jgi:hypothetical protein